MMFPKNVWLFKQDKQSGTEGVLFRISGATFIFTNLWVEFLGFFFLGYESGTVS